MPQAKTKRAEKSRFRMFLILMICFIVLAALGVYTYYLHATKPKYSVSDMKNIFSAARSRIEDIPQEKLAFGDALLQLLDTMPEEPPHWRDENDEKFRLWITRVRESGFMERLYSLAESGPGAIACNWDTDPDSLPPAHSGFSSVGLLLKEDLVRTIQADNDRRAARIIACATVLAQTAEYKTCNIMGLNGILIRFKIIEAVKKELFDMKPTMMQAVMRQLVDMEGTSPKLVEILDPFMMCCIEHCLLQGSLSLFLDDWPYRFQRIRSKAISVMLETNRMLMEAMKKPVVKAMPLVRKIKDNIKLAATTDGLYYLRCIIHSPADHMVTVAYKFFRACVSFEAQSRGVRIVMALTLFKNATGDYPDKLQVLAPMYLKTIPLDPFTCRPFFYNKMGTDYLLYSAGENQVDDGGKWFWNDDEAGDCIIARLAPK